MLSDTEKAYCQALLALKRKDYHKAVEHFNSSAQAFGTNSEFNLLYQTACLLVEVKKELASTVETLKIRSDEKELVING